MTIAFKLALYSLNECGGLLFSMRNWPCLTSMSKDEQEALGCHSMLDSPSHEGAGKVDIRSFEMPNLGYDAVMMRDR